MLDAKGRCCGKKPIQYKSIQYTGMDPHRYCPRCGMVYDLEDGEQIPNWTDLRVAKLDRKTNNQESA